MSDIQIRTVKEIPAAIRNGRTSRWADDWETLMAANVGEISELTFKTKADVTSFCASVKSRPFRLSRRNLAVFVKRVESA